MMPEHVVTRINDGYYVCDECGDAGSERWAILHQFPAEPGWLERGYLKLAEQQATDEERAVAQTRRARRDRPR